MLGQQLSNDNEQNMYDAVELNIKRNDSFVIDNTLT